MRLITQAIGFRSLDNTKEEFKQVIKFALENPDSTFVLPDEDPDIRFVEYKKFFGDNIGLIIRGVLDKDDHVSVHSWAPYFQTMNRVKISDLDIDRLDDDEFYSFCEDGYTKNELNFYLQNLGQFFEIDGKEIRISETTLAGLATNGTVLLPIDKNSTDYEYQNDCDKEFRNLSILSDTDDEAMDYLENHIKNANKVLTDRLSDEDLFSIIDGYFFPVEDRFTYAILGTILKVSQTVNTYTKEVVYCMTVSAIDFNVDICINEKDLIGMPTNGMRFIGTIWLQGEVLFTLAE